MFGSFQEEMQYIFIVEKLILINFFTVQVSGYDVIVIRWIFGTKNKGKLICNSPNHIISGNFDSEKVDQDGIFYYKDILHTKSHIWGQFNPLSIRALALMSKIVWH
jgi:hypothetical protein